MFLPSFFAVPISPRQLALACFLFMGALQAHAGSVNDLLSPGKMIRGHAKYESDCGKCHKRFDKAAQSGLCADCHKEVKKDLAEKRGYHGLAKDEKECKECHTEHKGREASIVLFDEEKFDHERADFLLKGGHADEKVRCKDCHVSGKKYREAPATCNSCHKKDDKHKGELGADCAKCHGEQDWKTTSFDHDKTTYPLAGKHADVKCKSCHIPEKYKGAPKQCASCHKKDDDKAHQGKFGQKCESCHSEKGWKEILFDHDKKTKYPLLWKHRDAKCTACHKGDAYKERLQTTCAACHKRDDDKAHKGNFGQKCESCHAEKGWKEILFDHDKKTKYPLLWKHRDAKCTACHKGDAYKEKLQTGCATCHKKDDDKAHKGNFGQKCESCHAEKGWKEILFDHDKKTKYPLLWKHRDAKCTACHKGDIYKEKLQSSCIACHQKDDKHKGQEGKKCESCHDEKTWTKAKFDHRQSRFPLTGKHIQTECKKCHAAPTFKDAKSDCWSCHEKQDTHKRRLGLLCEICHNARDWKVWDFDHDKTRFKLEGGHKKIGCYDCHQKPESGKINLPATCGGCHDKDDVHDGSFGRQCERCHDASLWKNIRAGGRPLQ
ncbi:MAG: Cytochrome C family protein [Gallionellaceae bacterium]|nr:MAG: Cytochrome C family protein [Gallionellaceae bacterium]